MTHAESSGVAVRLVGGGPALKSAPPAPGNALHAARRARLGGRRLAQQHCRLCRAVMDTLGPARCADVLIYSFGSCVRMWRLLGDCVASHGLGAASSWHAPGPPDDVEDDDGIGGSHGAEGVAPAARCGEGKGEGEGEKDEAALDEDCVAAGVWDVMSGVPSREVVRVWSSATCAISR